MRCFVFTWRSLTDGTVWTSERYAATKQQARTRFGRDVHGKGRVMFCKEHTGERYANQGRFV